MKHSIHFRTVLLFAVLVGRFPPSLAGEPAKPAGTGTARNVILMIGDGMGLAQISAARYHKGELAVGEMRHVGFSDTHSLRNFVTDSSAGATALATGYLIVNGEVAVAFDGTPLKTLIGYAKECGKWTGVVVTSRVTHATPASFMAHVKSRGNEYEIALQIATNGAEVILGGGWDMFLPPSSRSVKATEREATTVLVGAGDLPGSQRAVLLAEKPLVDLDGKPCGTRTDQRNLIAEMLRQGYRFVRTPGELSLITSGPPGKVIGLFHSGPMPRVTEGRTPSLSAMALAALEILMQSPNGFFLIIEGSQIDWGCHENNFDYAMEEAADLDTTVGAVVRFLKKAGIDGDTLVVVTADHETGGLTLNARGDLPLGFEPRWTTKDHTGVPVPVFAAGPRADLFSGMQSHERIGRSLIETVVGHGVSFSYPPDGSYPSRN